MGSAKIIFKPTPRPTGLPCLASIGQKLQPIAVEKTESIHIQRQNVPRDHQIKV